MRTLRTPNHHRGFLSVLMHYSYSQKIYLVNKSTCLRAVSSVLYQAFIKISITKSQMNNCPDCVIVKINNVSRSKIILIPRILCHQVFFYFTSVIYFLNISPQAGFSDQIYTYTVLFMKTRISMSGSISILANILTNSTSTQWPWTNSKEKKSYQGSVNGFEAIWTYWFQNVKAENRNKASLWVLRNSQVSRRGKNWV